MMLKPTTLIKHQKYIGWPIKKLKAIHFEIPCFFLKMRTDFQNSFSRWFVRKFSMYTWQRFPPHLYYVATLPCKIHKSKKCYRITAPQRTLDMRTLSGLDITFTLVRHSPRSRRHQVAAVSHILSSRSQSYLCDWVVDASHIHADLSQSYL